MRAMLDLYWNCIRMAILDRLQYRVAEYFYMIGMIAEPVIYLVVWGAVARSQGGSVAGYTAGDFTAYYIVWTLVRVMNIVLTPYAWEWRIRQGQLTGELMRPVHPVHFDLGFFIGWKFVAILLWLPMAAILILAFRPTLNPTPLDVAAFAVALWGGFLVRFFLQWALGMVTFWTTRVSAFFELYVTIELLFSGRLVPLALLPDWAQQVAGFLPFKWAFGYPIEVLIGQLSPQAIFAGLGMQAFWILVGVLVVAGVWRFALRRFTSVGN